ncbi:MAG: DUF4388 domain-containing protein [bacterium]
MSFRGELREFELPDIMQLIASQRKAGWLKVMTKGKTQFVFFHNGRITSTRNPNEEREPLEEYIRRRGFLTGEQLDRFDAARRAGQPIHDILRNEGFMEHDEIQELFEAMVEEHIFELMSIRSGTYEFETEAGIAVPAENAPSADIGPILMEGARKADEIAEMRAALGPEDGVLVLTAAGRSPEIKIAEERNVLALVNGVRTIEQILEECGLDRYTGTRILFDCARNGWVGLMRSRGAKRTAEEAVTGEFSLRKTLRWLTPVLGFLLASVLFSDALAPFRADEPVIGEWRSRASQMENGRREQAVRLALEAHRVKSGTYPSDLGALLGETLVPESALYNGDRERWEYALVPGSQAFVLAPARPGGEVSP